MEQYYYAELHTKDGVMLTKKYSTSSDLLNALAAHPDRLRGVDIRFFNVVSSDGGQRLNKGL